MGVLAALVLPGQAAALTPASCGVPGPSQSFTGHFSASQQGGFVFVPFNVPVGTTQVRVAYCWDASSGTSDHTLDLGVYQTRADSSRPWGRADFRGWGGSGYHDVTITRQGFSSEAQYDANRKAYVPGRTTRSFVPGPIPSGQWAAELGLANIDQTDLDGVNYRVEVSYYDDPSFDDVPYTRPRHDSRPARRGAAWYAGDFHVHAEHSGDAQASFTDVLNYAFKPKSSGGPGLDFVALTDHNTGTGWPEEDRRRSSHPRHLVLRGEEVTTYHGHTNNIASGVEPDYRTGPLYQRQANGSLSFLRGPQPVSKVFDTVNAAGGIAQINHPTIFPSPPFPSNLCRGCQWTHSEADTDYSKVDAIEVATGPQKVSAAPNPFIQTAIDFYDAQLKKGHHIAAVGGSDDHSAGTGTGATDAPIGQPTTVVRACDLSEQGVRRAVEARHTYVKVGGPRAPDLRLTASPRGSSSPPAIMGDTLHTRAQVDFRVGVTGGGSGYALQVIKNGSVVRVVPLTRSSTTAGFSSSGEGFYRLQVMQGQLVSAVSSPIWVTTAAGPRPDGGRCPAAVALPRLRVGFGRYGPSRVRHSKFKLRCRMSGRGRRNCRIRALAPVRGRLRTIAYKRVVVRGRSKVAKLKLNRRGRRLLRRHPRKLRVRIRLRASARGYRTGRASKRFRLRRRR